MYKSNLLSFGVRAITSLSLLFMLSSQIQAEERSPIERPSAAEMKNKPITIKVPSGSSARNIEGTIRKALEKNGHKPSASDRRKIKNAASKAAKGSTGSSRWTITIRIGRLEIIISSR